MATRKRNCRRCRSSESHDKIAGNCTASGGAGPGGCQCQRSKGREQRHQSTRRSRPAFASRRLSSSSFRCSWSKPMRAWVVVVVEALAEAGSAAGGGLGAADLAGGGAFGAGGGAGGGGRGLGGRGGGRLG